MVQAIVPGSLVPAAKKSLLLNLFIPSVITTYAFSSVYGRKLHHHPYTVLCASCLCMFTVTRTDGWMGDPQKSEVVPPIPYLPQIFKAPAQQMKRASAGCRVGVWVQNLEHRKLKKFQTTNNFNSSTIKKKKLSK